MKINVSDTAALEAVFSKFRTGRLRPPFAAIVAVAECKTIAIAYARTATGARRVRERLRRETGCVVFVVTNSAEIAEDLALYKVPSLLAGNVNVERLAAMFKTGFVGTFKGDSLDRKTFKIGEKFR
jgi:hypothetical protein